MASTTRRDKVTSASLKLTDINNDVLATKYENMLNSVTNMINNDGFTYSTWIYFQIGKDDANSLVFNNSSTNKKENLIASLNIEKTGAGIANKFTLVVHYDPFNYGQETTDQIDKLETFIADAMSENFSETSKSCIGLIQYGYNSTSDDNLISPLYEFFLTSASTDVKFDSGIVTYKFEGVSTIAADCDYTTTYEALFPDDKEEKTSLLAVVGKILYKYYGDPEKKPSFITEDIDVMDNDYKYYINISDDLLEISPKITYKDATSDTIVYCKYLLDSEPRTQPEIDSGNYDDLDSISVNQRPRWVMSITDVSGGKCIHISHLRPKSTKDENGNEVIEKSDDTTISINYAFTWGSRDRNGEVIKSLVVGWHPEVDLYTYLIRKSLVKRLDKLKELAFDTSLNEETRNSYVDKYKAMATDVEESFREMYNAELELVGIPADPPLTAEIQIIPRILEAESRTSGIYAITGATDVISNTGIFISTLKLFRLRSIDNVKELDISKEPTLIISGGEPVAGNAYA